MEKKVLEIEELVRVDSSNIDMVGYNGDTTYVQFKNGGVYCYPKTQRQEFEALSKAQSVGSHFAKTYRNKDQYAKLDNTELKAQKKKLTDEELQNYIIGQLRYFSENNMHDATTGMQRMYAKDLITLVRDNSDKPE